jgi:hypothetical protein
VLRIRRTGGVGLRPTLGERVHGGSENSGLGACVWTRPHDELNNCDNGILGNCDDTWTGVSVAAAPFHK